MAPSRALLSLVEQRLLECEARIDVLGRLTPRNFAEQLAACRRDPRHSPRFEYSPLPESSEFLPLLERARQALASWGDDVVAQVLRDRVDELALEVELVLARGSPRIRELSRRRYPCEKQEAEAASELGRSWLALPVPVRTPGDDHLIALAPALAGHQLTRHHGIAVVERDMAALAAIDGSRLLVRRGARVGAAELERVVVHELGAHLLPRLRARSEGPPFRLGPAGCSEEEEGWAITLEERAGLLDVGRRRELGARHGAAEVVLEGGSFAEVRDSLLAWGASEDLATLAALRALRGGDGQHGGLARERIYLIGYLRLGAAFREEPELEGWFERGRMTLRGARQLRSQPSAATQS